MYHRFPPADYVEGGRHVQTEVMARDRHKFYARPQLPVLGTTAPNFTPQRAPPVVPQAIHQLQQKEKLQRQAAVSAAANGGSPSAPAAPRRPHGARPATMVTGREAAAIQNLSPTIHHHGGHLVRSVVCQTDMRENEAQTDPYTPDYYVEEGQNPEVLAIMSLKHGDGLPAKKSEIEMIDRVRRRRQVEESLPQGADEESMQKRLQMLEELEQAEWREREEHIKALQGAKLQGIAQAMTKRELKREEASAARVAAVKEKADADYDEKMRKLQRRRFKQTRTLAEIHADPLATVTHKKPDRIEGYATHGPRGKAVETKSLIEKPKSKFYDARPTLLSFPEGVQELERTEGHRVDRVRKADMKAPEEITLSECTTKYQQRRVKQVAADLEYANATIQKNKQGPLGTTSIQDLYRATPRLIRPDTPTLVLEGDDEEEMEEALILLQRLMRGRAVQNDFFEGKERCHGLIEELQAAQKAKESERKYLKKEDEEREQKRKEDIVNGVLDSIQGDVVHTTLDYLAKELLRQRQAALFDRLREEALATRQRREQAEQQRRVAEEPLRLLADERYRQIVQTTEYSIHTYLTGIMEESIAETAHRAAFEEQLQIIDLEAEEERKQQERAAEEDRSEDQIREDTICALLKNFVMPQVAKELKAIDERR